MRGFSGIKIKKNVEKISGNYCSELKTRFCWCRAPTKYWAANMFDVCFFNKSGFCKKTIGMCDSFYLTKNHAARTVAFENERSERRSKIRTIFGGHIRLGANIVSATTVCCQITSVPK